MVENLYDALSEERKRLQEEGKVPLWYSTGGYQMFKEKYEYDTTYKGEHGSVSAQFERIARTAAKHYIVNPDLARSKFYELLWNGWLSPSTPVLANMGTDRGLPISCSGAVIDDSIFGFYSTQLETAMLTKNGFGTSAYLGDIRARGSVISVGGKASGVMPVFKDYVQLTRDVSQGTARRGAWAGYLPIDHGDFDELADFVLAEPDDANVGWNISDDFIARLDAKDPDATRRFQKAMKLKMTYGKGYFMFPDKIAKRRPQAYIDHDLYPKASNLCSEIMLFADKDHTYTCVLSSLNVAKFDEWKDTDAAYWATIFLDCVVSEFLEKARNIPGLEKAVRFTEKGRALGLGACGLHTYFQEHMMAWDGMEAHFANMDIFSHIQKESLKASQHLAEVFGEPEWCEGLGIRNTHRMAIAPTKSTALLMGGVSEGINPDPAMSFTQLTAAGEVERVNPALLKIMKERGVNTKKHLKALKESMGSVQQVDWLSPEEKAVFRTAFEINQEAIVRMASTRAQYLDQWQSLNLFFAAEEDPARIAAVHKMAFKDPKILALYYIYTQAGVQAANEECAACQ